MPKKEMLINTVEGQECRIAILEDGLLEELYVERASSASRVGNIYKGRVTNVEPAIQAAFVDFGLVKNGFLHISDLHPQYFPKGSRGREAVGAKQPRHERPSIQSCLRRGQEVVVQITKEGIGTKGPTLTTYISIPGRLLVMMPGMSRLGVSKKIEDEETRAKARGQLAQLKLPNDMGFILRTAGIDRPKRELQRDLNYLLRLWLSVEKRIKSAKAPAEIYQESDLVTRTIRDIYNADISRIVCDSEAIARKVREFLNMALPRTKNVIELYVGKRGLFFDYGLEDEIEKIYSRRVELPSGGSLVIDQAEALVAIDVNSGRFREHSDAETTALRTDVEAVKEIVRQLRLRDLGGVIIIDFIDLREDRHRREVERAMREALKNDRAKTKVGRMSNFGIVEMTRQRVRPSLEHAMHVPCPNCGGTGFLKSDESQALQVMRCLQRACAEENTATIEVAVTPAIAHHLTNAERNRLFGLEQRTGKRIVVRADDSLGGDEVQLTCTDKRGAVITCDAHAQHPQGQPRHLETVNIDDVGRTTGGSEAEAHEPEILPEQYPEGMPEEIPDELSEGMTEKLIAELSEESPEEFAEEGEDERPEERPQQQAQPRPQQPPRPQPQQAHPRPQQPRPPAQPRPAQGARPGQPAQPGQPGQPPAPGAPGVVPPGGKKKRRRGRRGGRRQRHRKQAAAGQQNPQGQPSQPTPPSGPPPQNHPTDRQPDHG